MKKNQNYCAGKKRDVTIITHRYKGLTMEVEKHKNNMMLVPCACQEKIRMNITEFHTPNNYLGRLRGIDSDENLHFFFFFF